MMKIAVDAFGGDNAPLDIMKGSEMAVRELGVQIMMAGDVAVMKKVATENNISLEGIELVDAPQVMPVEEDPTKLLKEYNNSSMYKAFELVANGECEAFVSAGSTGAVTVGATFITKRMKGVKRVAIGCVIPTSTGSYMLMDSGANAECRPEMLQQFGMMGSVYMNKVMGVKNPRVALVNIGAEETKGTDLQLGAYERLKASSLNFTGNIEAREIPLGGCDVAVCDGFTGNIILKLTEGMGAMMKNEMKDMFLTSLATKIGALFVKKQLDVFKDKFSAKKYGGAMVVGTQKPVVKAHGSSDSIAFKNAIRQAKLCVDNKIVETLQNAIAETSSQ